MSHKRISMILFVLLALLVAACGGGDGGGEEEEMLRVAVIMPSTINDLAYLRQTGLAAAIQLSQSAQAAGKVPIDVEQMGIDLVRGRSLGRAGDEIELIFEALHGLRYALIVVIGMQGFHPVQIQLVDQVPGGRADDVSAKNAIGCLVGDDLEDQPLATLAQGSDGPMRGGRAQLGRRRPATI